MKKIIKPTLLIIVFVSILYPITYSQRPTGEILIRWPYPDNRTPDLFVGETYTIEIQLVDPDNDPLPNEDIVATHGRDATMDILKTDQDGMVNFEFTVDSSSDHYFIIIEWAGNEDYGGCSQTLTPETMGGASEARDVTPRVIPSHPRPSVLLGVILGLFLYQKHVCTKFSS